MRNCIQDKAYNNNVTHSNFGNFLNKRFMYLKITLG